MPLWMGGTGNSVRAAPLSECGHAPAPSRFKHKRLTHPYFLSTRKSSVSRTLVTQLRPILRSRPTC